jgi:hypothetical protein
MSTTVRIHKKIVITSPIGSAVVILHQHNLLRLGFTTNRRRLARLAPYQLSRKARKWLSISDGFTSRKHQAGVGNWQWVGAKSNA